MGRANIPIKWIPRDASRSVTFVKRKKGLKKKVEELAILCGVEACMICFGPQADRPSEPDVWPVMPKTLRIIDRYKSLSKEEQDKKKLDNSSFLEQRINKLRVELTVKRKENKGLETDSAYPPWDNRLNSLTVEKLRDLVDYIDVRLGAVQERIDFLSMRQEQVCKEIRDMDNNLPLAELESISRAQSMEDPLPQMMVPYNLPYHGHESLSSILGAMKPCPSLEEQYIAAMPLPKDPYSASLDYYVATDPKDYPLFSALKDHNMGMTSKEQYGNENNSGEKKVVNMDSLGEDTAIVGNANVMMNRGFPLLDDFDVQPLPCARPPQWRCTFTPVSCCPAHVESVYCCPQHYMNLHAQTSIQQHQNWLNELNDLQNIQQKLMGDASIEFANNDAPLPPLLVDRSGADQACKIKNIQDGAS